MLRGRKPPVAWCVQKSFLEDLTLSLRSEVQETGKPMVMLVGEKAGSETGVTQECIQ